MYRRMDQKKKYNFTLKILLICTNEFHITTTELKTKMLGPKTNLLFPVNLQTLIFWGPTQTFLKPYGILKTF